MKDNEKLYHSALSRCAEQLDNMRDGDPITDVPDFLAAKLKQCQLAGAAKGGNTSAIDSWTGHEIKDDPSLNFVEFVKISDAAHLASQSQAAQPTESKITDGDSARAFVDAWHREHFPTDRTFSRYIMGRNQHCALAGDFAWQLAKALESMDVAHLAGQSQATRAVPDLHNAIMNLPALHAEDVYSTTALAYKCGHRDARHAAAELAIGAEVAQEVTQQAAKAETAEQAEGDQANVLPPTRGTEGQHDANSAADDQWVFDLAAEHEANRNGLYGPVTFGATGLLDFARAIEAEVTRRFRAQGGNTGDKGSHLAPTTSTVSAPTDAVRDVLAERQRQVEVEGWTPERDDTYDAGELSLAASCYALAGDGPHARFPEDWPWDGGWWKPADDRRNLVKAGALILADIERIDREALRTTSGKGEAA